MKWIKASERLPERTGAYIVKHWDDYGQRPEISLHWGGFDAVHKVWVGNKWKNEDVEWLDEQSGQDRIGDERLEGYIQEKDNAIGKLKQEIERLKGENKDLIAYAEYVKRMVLKGIFPMPYEAYK